MVHEDSVLEVLARIREVEAQELRLAAGRAVGHQWTEADYIATQRDVRHEETGVASQQCRVRPHVHSVAIPGLAGDDRGMRAVSDTNLDIAREDGAATVLDEDGASAERGELDDQVCSGSFTLTRDDDMRAPHRLGRER